LCDHVYHAGIAGGTKGHWQYAKMSQYTAFVISEFTLANIALMCTAHVIKSFNHSSTPKMFMNPITAALVVSLCHRIGSAFFCP
jgi:hypothetical protein